MKKYCLFSFIFVGILVLGFGVPYIVSAVTTCNLDPGHPDGSTCTVDILYEDPKPEINSGLKVCEYQVVLKDSATSDNWQSAGACSGKDPVTISVNIDISTNNPEISESGIYRIWKRATDEANNTSTPLYTGVSFLADLEKPLVSADNSSSSWINESVTITLSTSDTGGSGWKEARYSWDDNAMNAFCTSGGTKFNNNKKLSADEGSHVLYLCARDAAGNTNTWNGEYKVDSEKPEITVFNAEPTLLSLSNLTTIISYTVSDPTPGSGLNRVELWKKRAEDNWPSSTKEDFKQSVSGNIDSGSFQDTFLPGADGIYNYGIHVIDNVDNRCTESDNPCGKLVSVLTVEVKTLPDAPYNLHASGEGPAVIDLNWTKGDGAGRTIIRRKTGGFPTSITEGNEAYNGTGSSVIDTGLTESTTYYYRAWSVKSVVGYGDLQSSSYDEVIESTTISNSPPSISSVSDAPDPIRADVSLTFNVNWSDPNGDSVKLFICKSANGVTGGNCQGSSNTWCKDASATSTSPAFCSYITNSGDAGTKNYYAYVCDGSACSSPSSGSFLVDAILPTISFFDVTPIPPEWISSISEDVTISWTVGDSGGSFLKDVQIWRSGDGGGSWVLASTVPAPLSYNSWESFTTDAPSSGTYLYGIHVLDNADNEITESEAGFTPISIQADTTNPTAAITNPGAGTWFKEPDPEKPEEYLVATFDDSDLGGSGLVNTCEYRFIGLNPSGSDFTSGDLTRDCDFDTKTIELGVGEVCQFEGQNRCKVQTRAFDNAGNTSGWQSRSFGVDFTDPEITNIQPSAVQVGAVTTVIADLVDPIGHITGCTLYAYPVGSSEWIPYSTTIDPIPCENGGACTVSGDYIFPDIGEYDVKFACIDQAGNTGWGASTTQADTLSVVGVAIPSSGTQQTQFDLEATVSGTIAGTINYKFDCTSDGTWELEVDGEAASVYIAEDVCSYSSEDTYIAKVLAERGIGSAEDTVSIIVSSNGLPSAINLQDNNDTVDYCPVGAPPIILSWDFDDPNLPGDSQSAYQVQVDINSGFSSPEIDSGKVSSSSTNYVPVGLSYDERYWWRVMVWDQSDDSSSWATGSSFITPVHAYPNTAFSWSPLFPSNDEEVQFTDETIFAPISTGQSWSWDFGDTIGSSTEQNPVYIYADTTSYEVTLTALDDVGSCISSQVVRVSVPLPEWLEISPF
ncbi:MAG: PKD domain-containing protein [Patescibacteria group bacterium]|nr:PKD domain-containing protein [Patescibacteria group bacterium]